MNYYKIQNPDSAYFTKIASVADPLDQGSLIVRTYGGAIVDTKSYLIIGEPYQSSSELHLPSSVEGENILLNDVTRYRHNISTPIYQTDLKFISIYVSLDNGQTWNQVRDNGHIHINWDEPFTKWRDTNDYGDKKPIYEYSYSGINTVTETERNKLESTDLTGITTQTEGTSFQNVLRQVRYALLSDAFNTTLDGILLNLANTIHQEVLHEIRSSRKHLMAEIFSMDLEPMSAVYKLPFLADGISEVRINGCTIDRIDITQLPQMCNIGSCKPCEDANKGSEDRCSKCECKTGEILVPKCNSKGVVEYVSEEVKLGSCGVCEDNNRQTAGQSNPCSDCGCVTTYYYYVNNDIITIFPTPNKTLKLSVVVSAVPDIITANTVNTGIFAGFESLYVTGILVRYYTTYETFTAELSAKISSLSRLYEKELDRLSEKIAAMHSTVKTGGSLNRSQKMVAMARYGSPSGYNNGRTTGWLRI